jgi:hypothetical protein
MSFASSFSCEIDRTVKRRQYDDTVCNDVSHGRCGMGVFGLALRRRIRIGAGCFRRSQITRTLKICDKLSAWVILALARFDACFMLKRPLR